MPPPAALQLHPERTSKNMLAADARGGQLVAQQDAAGHWRITQHNRTLLDGTPLAITRIRLLTVATAPDADLVVALLNTGTACPVQFAVLAIPRSGHPTATPPFGTCADLSALRTDGNALVFTMPTHTSAPDATSFRYAAGTVTGPLSP